MACGDWLDQYLDYCKLRFVGRTYQTKVQIFREFVAFAGPGMKVEGITPGLALDYQRDVAERRTPGAANVHRTHLMAAWSWGHKFLAFPLPAPFLLVGKLPARKKERYIPPMSDFLKVLDAAEGQDHVLLLTYLHTAARKNELFSATWSDVDFGVQRIRLWTNKTGGKGRKAAWIDMTDELARVLASHRRKNPDSLFLFTKANGKPYRSRHTWLKPFCAQVGVKPFDFHSIRHLTATYLIDKQFPLPVVQSILRHSSISVTAIYLHSLQPQKAALMTLPTGKSQQEANSSKIHKGNE